MKSVMESLLPAQTGTGTVWHPFNVAAANRGSGNVSVLLNQPGATLTIADQNVPTLNATPVTFTGINEDPTTNNGDAVNIAAITNLIYDVDAGAVEGIAVISVDNTNGKWQYSTDSGSTWQDFSATAAPFLALPPIGMPAISVLR
ncbi:hypothetical protein [Kamptonema formosum]|uniref:hypothetical protein n=1 Tax=Kamptonema formosum TaxID=331992 RepID=UPI00036A63FD|nr:hypothetical protein [Oscillatoria sp. PCC 10802]